MAKKRVSITEVTIKGLYHLFHNAPCIITRKGKDFAMLTLIDESGMMRPKKGSKLESHESSQKLSPENEKEEYDQTRTYEKKQQRVPKQGAGFEICQKCFNAQGTEIIEEDGIEYHVCKKCLDQFKHQTI
jgi:hypothetical protein